MGIYICIFGILFFCCLFDTKKVNLAQKKMILCFLILLFTLFRGLRWENGTDWGQYLEVFQDINIDNFYNYTRKGTSYQIEILYGFLNALIKVFSDDYMYFLLFTNLLCLYSYYRFAIRFSLYPILAFASILCSMNFFPVRQDIAAAVLLYAYPYICSKRFWPFFFVVCIAQLIHNTSFVFFVVYFISNTNFSIKKVNLILLSTIFIGKFLEIVVSYVIPYVMILSTSLGNKLNVYSLSDEGFVEDEMKGKGILGIIMIYGMVLLMIYFVNHIKSKDFKLYSINSVLFVVTLLFYCMKFVFTGPLVYISRLSVAFGCAGAVLFINSLMYMGLCYNKRHSNFKISFLLVAIVYLIFRFYRMTNVFPDAHFPYHFLNV